MVVGPPPSARVLKTMPGDRHQTHQTVRRFKGETVFDWEAEPSSERPSEFTESTQTQYGHVFAPSTRSRNSTLEVARPRPPQKRGGLGAMWIAIVISFAVVAGSVIGYTRYREGQLAAAADRAAELAARSAPPPPAALPAKSAKTNPPAARP